MGESVKVTVAMGVYEPRDLEQLRWAVGSILEQTCGDWELLLYDGKRLELERVPVERSPDCSVCGT